MSMLRPLARVLCVMGVMTNDDVVVLTVCCCGVFVVRALFLRRRCVGGGAGEKRERLSLFAANFRSFA